MHVIDATKYLHHDANFRSKPVILFMVPWGKGRQVACAHQVHCVVVIRTNVFPRPLMCPSPLGSFDPTTSPRQNQKLMTTSVGQARLTTSVGPGTLTSSQSPLKFSGEKICPLSLCFSTPGPSWWPEQAPDIVEYDDLLLALAQLGLADPAGAASGSRYHSKLRAENWRSWKNTKKWNNNIIRITRIKILKKSVKLKGTKVENSNTTILWKRNPPKLNHFLAGV